MEKLSKILALILVGIMVINVGVFATDIGDTTEESTTEVTTEVSTTQATTDETTTPEDETTTDVVEEESTEAPSEESTTEEITETPSDETTTEIAEEESTEAPSEEETTAAIEESTTEATEEESTTSAEETTTEVSEETTTEVTEESTTVPEDETTTVPEESTTTPDETVTTTPEVTDPTEPTEPEVTEPTEPEEPVVELPAAPANIKAGAFKNGNVSVTWDAVEGATGYDVYLKSGDEWVYQSAVTKTKCTLKNALYNSKYVMGIKTFVTVDGEKHESKEMAEYTVLTGADIPTTKFTLSTSGDTVTLKWDAIKGVSGYRVYIKQDGKWVKITSISENTYTYKKALPGKTYKFAIKPYSKGSEGTKFGKLQTGKIATEDYSKTTAKTTDKTTSTITIKWSKVKNASSYRVYIRKDGKWTYYKGITKNTYTLKGLKDATNYKIKVKPCFKVDGNVYWGSYSNTLTVATAGKTVKAYRIDELKKKFTKDNWSIKVYFEEGTDEEVAITMAVKGNMVYTEENYKTEYIDTITLCNLKTQKSYLIRHSLKQFTEIPDPSRAQYEYELLSDFVPLDAKNVKAKTTVFNGKSVVAEYYTTKDGMKITYYFSGSKVVGVKFAFDGYSTTYTSYKILAKPSDSLFKFPSGYEEGRY